MDDTSEPLAEALAVPDPFRASRAVIATEWRDWVVPVESRVLSVLAASIPPFEPKPI